MNTWDLGDPFAEYVAAQVKRDLEHRELRAMVVALLLDHPGAKSLTHYDVGGQERHRITVHLDPATIARMKASALLDDYQIRHLNFPDLDENLIEMRWTQ